MSSTVESELWNIFTYYTLFGNPLDPEYMRKSQFIKMLKDCLLVKRGYRFIVNRHGRSEKRLNRPSDEALACLQLLERNHAGYRKKMLSTSEANLVFLTVVKKSKSKTERSALEDQRASSNMKKRMTYNDFLNALMKVAIEVYADHDDVKNVDDAFQMLLIQNVLPAPLASRREPQTERVDAVMAQPAVSDLFATLDSALFHLFCFYASEHQQKFKAIKAMHKRHVDVSDLRGFDLAKSKLAATSEARKAARLPALDYPEFLKFSHDFKFASSVLLTTLELGDIYLSALRTHQASGYIRKLTFDEFKQALLQCALVAYSKGNTARIRPVDKVKGLLLHMWRALNRSVPRAIEERKGLSTYSDALANGAALFNQTCTEMWERDGYRDYLSEAKPSLDDARLVLDRLLTAPPKMRLTDGPHAATAPALASAPVLAPEPRPVPGPPLDLPPPVPVDPSRSAAGAATNGHVKKTDRVGETSVSADQIKAYLKTKPGLVNLLRTHMETDPGNAVNLVNEAAFEKAAFGYLDANNDGQVSTEEYNRAMLVLSSEILK